MALFNVIVKGTPIKQVLILSSSTSNACDSVHTFLVNGNVGDSITLTLTPSVGYTGARYTLGTASITSPHTFTFSEEKKLKVYMENSGAVETVNVEVDALNNTTAQNTVITVERDSVGAEC